MTKRDRAGRSALHYASLEADVNMVSKLLDEGYDVNEADSNGFTPLHFAAQSHALEVTRLLVQHGATIDAVNVHGNSPLLVAMLRSAGRKDEIALLRDLGADPNLKNKTGISAVDLARTITNFDLKDLFPETRA